MMDIMPYTLVRIAKLLEPLYLQLYINGLQTKGIRLKDIPEEYFEIPEAGTYLILLIVTIEFSNATAFMIIKTLLRPRNILSINR